MMNAKDTSKYTPQQLADAERFMQLLFFRIRCNRPDRRHCKWK